MWESCHRWAEPRLVLRERKREHAGFGRGASGSDEGWWGRNGGRCKEVRRPQG